MKDLKKEDVSNLSYKDIAYLIIEKEKSLIFTNDTYERTPYLL